uniref:Uncharacterized protein n=1 Tax=Oryza brachyantha TaxID=4533 RepID=J3MZN0_ORYBR
MKMVAPNDHATPRYPTPVHVSTVAFWFLYPMTVAMLTYRKMSVAMNSAISALYSDHLPSSLVSSSGAGGGAQYGAFAGLRRRSPLRRLHRHLLLRRHYCLLLLLP